MATSCNTDSEAGEATASLESAARILSHEFRTPMQGVLGMLDIMHATVQEAIESQRSSHVTRIFQSLKENIQVVQDSSCRAFDAADNIIRVYELSTRVPELSFLKENSPSTMARSLTTEKSRANRMANERDVVGNPSKRQKISPLATTNRSDAKFFTQQNLSPQSERSLSSASSPSSGQGDSTKGPMAQSQTVFDNSRPSHWSQFSARFDVMEINGLPTSTPLSSNLRDLLPVIIYKALRTGGRPESSVAVPTQFGEKIEVSARSCCDQTSYQVVEWSVQPGVPESLPIDEQDLSKLISCVFLNAIKFAENGNVQLVASVSRKDQALHINVIDNGIGISQGFLPRMFKPFSRQDGSLTRRREGLGLGLLVAKGLARKLGGELCLLRTETSGKDRGSEFEITLPVGSHGSEPWAGTFDRTTPLPTNSSPVLRKATTSDIAPPSPEASLFVPCQLFTGADNVVNPASSAFELDTSAPTLATKLSPASSTVAIPYRKPLDCQLAQKYPLIFLVAEDNRIVRKLLVGMLTKLGYRDVYEAHNGHEAVKIMRENIAAFPESSTSQRASAETYRAPKPVNVILMDLWMPEMDGYEATTKILDMFKVKPGGGNKLKPMATPPRILAVTADSTEKAIVHATAAGMEGFMTKPYKILDLQKLIKELCNGTKS